MVTGIKKKKTEITLTKNIRVVIILLSCGSEGFYKH